MNQLLVSNGLNDYTIMATYDSSLYTAQAAALTDYSQAPNLKQAGGNLHILHAQVTLPSSAVNDEVLNLAYLPPGAKVIPALSKVQCPVAVGTNFKLNVGTLQVPNTYALDIVIASATATAFDSTAPATVDAQVNGPVKTAGSTLVTATIKSKSTIVNNTKLTFFIAYTLG